MKHTTRIMTIHNFTQPKPTNTENHENLRQQLDLLHSQVIHSSIADNQQTRENFIQTIQQLKSDTSQIFKDETLRKVESDLKALKVKGDPQEAYSIVQYFTRELRNRGDEQ